MSKPVYLQITRTLVSISRLVSSFGLGGLLLLAELETALLYQQQLHRLAFVYIHYFL
jgi:hypothetical protein